MFSPTNAYIYWLYYLNLTKEPISLAVLLNVFVLQVYYFCVVFGILSSSLWFVLDIFSNKKRANVIII